MKGRRKGQTMDKGSAPETGLAGEAKKPSQLATFKTMIRRAGLRGTGPRMAVLRLLTESPVPLSHGDIVEALKADGMDRATIYRNLVDMTAAGLLTRSDLGHIWRFEFRQPGAKKHSTEHAHFVCLKCGDVSCLLETAVTIVPDKAAPRAVAARSVEIQLKGLCDTCSI
jgi:Fur family ferric uptake transcriptional regulator